ncbi:MAG: carboxypeptidase-like regulatory domain-containing protein [Candidatus Sulfotelmatobacter sp.]
MKHEFIARRFSRTPFECLFMILLAVGALAQEDPSSISSSQALSSQPSSTTTCALLQGVVTRDPGSEPVKKALVELIAESQNDSANYTALTAADGSFRMENIKPGRYRLFVERTGYQEIDKHHRHTEGRVLTLTAGQEVKDVAIILQAAAVVEGRVTDEDGDPLAEAQVAVLRQTFVQGHSHWEQSGAERTNDLGEYRIAGLAPGKYFVAVTPPPDFRSLIETAGNAPGASSRAGAASEKPAPLVYQTTFYPGTRDRAQATPIPLHAGDDFPANFSLTPSPSLTIRGSVVNLPPGSSAAILLQSKDFNLVLSGAEMHKDGSFEIRDVSPGAYNIVATVDNVAVPMMARQSLQLAESVEGLRLSPQSGGAIRGRLRMEPGANSRPDPSQFFLLLHSLAEENDSNDDSFGAVTMGGGFSNLAHVSGDGSFSWKDVPPGAYSVQISDVSAMPDWFLKSATSDGHDATDSGISVGGGAITLDLMASANGGTIDGVASNQDDEAVADAVIVAVPEARFRNHQDRYRKAVSDQSGHFSLRGLPPGDYTLFAWQSIDGEPYYNPEFLRNYEDRGKAMRVREGNRVSVQLKTIPPAEDQP